MEHGIALAPGAVRSHWAAAGGAGSRGRRHGPGPGSRLQKVQKGKQNKNIGCSSMPTPTPSNNPPVINNIRIPQSPQPASETIAWKYVSFRPEYQSSSTSSCSSPRVALSFRLAPKFGHTLPPPICGPLGLTSLLFTPPPPSCSSSSLLLPLSPPHRLSGLNIGPAPIPIGALGCDDIWPWSPLASTSTKPSNST